MVHDRSTQPPPGSRENRSHVQSVADSRPWRWCALSFLRLLSQRCREGFSGFYVPRLILIGHDEHQGHVVSRKISSRDSLLPFIARHIFHYIFRSLISECTFQLSHKEIIGYSLYCYALLFLFLKNFDFYLLYKLYQSLFPSCLN